MEVEEESSEEESSDEEEVWYIAVLNLSLFADIRWINTSSLLQTPPPKAVKKATPAKGTPLAKNGAVAKKAESDDDDDSGKHEISQLDKKMNQSGLRDSNG